MGFALQAKDLNKLARVLHVRPKRLGHCVRFEVSNVPQKRSMAVEIYSDIPIGSRRGTLVSVYTATTHLQLHFCTGYVASTLLGEVTFVGESDGKLSGLTIEREGGCSLYANVDRDILSGDFTRLGPEVMLSGIALSLAESILPEGAGKATRPARRRKR